MSHRTVYHTCKMWVRCGRAGRGITTRRKMGKSDKKKLDWKCHVFYDFRKEMLRKGSLAIFLQNSDSRFFVFMSMELGIYICYLLLFMFYYYKAIVRNNTRKETKLSCKHNWLGQVQFSPGQWTMQTTTDSDGLHVKTGTFKSLSWMPSMRTLPPTTPQILKSNQLNIAILSIIQ